MAVLGLISLTEGVAFSVYYPWHSPIGKTFFLIWHPHILTLTMGACMTGIQTKVLNVTSPALYH